MSPLTPEVRAVVRAADALTAQVRRIADALSAGVAPRADDTDDDTGRPVVGIDPGRPPALVAHLVPSEAYTAWTDQAPAADDTPDAAAPNMLRVLADRAARGALTEDEGPLLRRRVEQIINGRDTWKAKAEEIEQDRDDWRRRAESLEAERERMRELLEYEHKRANDAISREETADQDAEEQRRRAEGAEIELRTLRAGLRANGADPTQIQNLWAQISLRNRQWRDEKRERAEAEAALERVRALLDSHLGPLATAVVRRALDGTEQRDDD